MVASIGFVLPMTHFNHYCRVVVVIFIVITVIIHYTKANSAFHPFGVGEWVPASVGKAKAGRLWFIPLADVRTFAGCAGKTVRYHENACHTWAP